MTCGSGGRIFRAADVWKADRETRVVNADCCFVRRLEMIEEEARWVDAACTWRRSVGRIIEAMTVVVWTVVLSLCLDVVEDGGYCRMLGPRSGKVKDKLRACEWTDRRA